jgi:arsenite methyltransferase
MHADVAFWNNIATRDARQPVEDPAAFERKIALTLAQMKPGDVVLDIGCGTGSLARRLAETGARVHGLDDSAAMVDIARAKARAQGVENATFHLGAFDETFTEFAPGTLEGLYAGSLLHLVPDRATVLRKAFGLLKPGGFFVSSTVCLGESWVPLTPVLRVMRWLGRAPAVWSLSRATLLRDIAEAGFVDVTEPDVGASPKISFVMATRP